MGIFTYVIDGQGYWLAISTSGTVEFNDKWNLNNIPTKHHKWNCDLEDFILDEAIELQIEKNKEMLKLNSLLDENKQKLINNRVIYTENDSNFLEYEKKYRKQREILLGELKNIL